jgi:anti-sigma factor ChrR (cupin superfamily)
MNSPGHLLATAAVAAGSLAGLPAFGQATPSRPSELTAEEKAQVEAIRRERLKEHDETVQRALEEHRALLRAARTANDRAAAVWKLADAEKDPKIVAELARRLNDAEIVRGEALAALAKHTGDASASPGRRPAARPR